MSSDLYGPPSRIALIHPVPTRAKVIVEALRRAGHQIRLLLPGPGAVEGANDHEPDLVIAHASLADDVKARGPVFDAPVICLGEAGIENVRLRADALLIEPVDPQVLRICSGGLLRANHETRKLRRKSKDLGALYKLSWAFSLEGGPEQLYGYIAEQTAQMLEAEKGLVLGIDAEAREIVGRPRGYGIPAEVVAELRYPIEGEAIQRWNFRKNGPLLSDDAPNDPRLLPEVVERLGMKTLLAVPMATGHSIVGLLVVGNRARQRNFGEEDMSLLLAAGSLAAVAIDNLELHEDVKKANVTLKEYDRLKTQFVAMVAHDFRRPLTAIRGFAEIVTVDEPPIETIKEYMDAIVDECDGLARLADDTLLLSKLETATIEFRWTEVDLKALLREVIPSDLAGHSVWLDVPSELPRAIVDLHRLRQVLSNLFSNAIKYSPKGGTITLRCRVEDDQVTIQVADQGLGIPKDQQASLFQRFSRVQTDEHMAITGTGLGLYISRLIVEGHGGRVWVESEPGQGSTFCLRLPLDARPKREQPQPQPEAKKPAPRASGPITSMFRPHLTKAVRRATGEATKKQLAAKAALAVQQGQGQKGDAAARPAPAAPPAAAVTRPPAALGSPTRPAAPPARPPAAAGGGAVGGPTQPPSADWASQPTRPNSTARPSPRPAPSPQQAAPPPNAPPPGGEPVMTPDDSQTRLYERAEMRRSPRVRRMIPIRLNYNGATLTTYTAVINREGALIICAVAVPPGTTLQITSLATHRSAAFDVIRCSEAEAGQYKIGVQLKEEQDFWGVAYDAQQSETGPTPSVPRGARR